MFKLLRGKKETGQGMIEYGLIISLVAVLVIGVITIMGPQLTDVFGSVNGSLAAGAPAPTVVPVPTWHTCASEGGTCSFTGSALVRYGANGTYATLTLVNGAACNNATFGDPLPNIVKGCEYFQ